MSLKDQLKSFLKKTTGLSFYKHRPLGVDPFQDVKERIAGYNFKTFLDVGANVGQTARQIRAAFPNAIIHSLEPIKNTFQLLQQNTKGYNVMIHNVALGSKNETVEINIDENNTISSINSLVKSNNEINSGQPFTETIKVVTTDNFCNSLGIKHIDYLKIDTEGYDLEVIKGASNLLSSNAISFIEVEVSMNPNNTFHVSLEEVKKYLEENNYFLFGLYEQVLEWKIKAPVLRRCNALFISGELVKQYSADDTLNGNHSLL